MEKIKLVFNIGLLIFLVGCGDEKISNPSLTNKNSNSMSGRSNSNYSGDLSPNYIDIYDINNVIYTRGTRVYEDAEDGNTLGWYIYDSNCAEVANIDNDTTRVIQLKGEGLSSGFVLRNMNGELLNNLDARVIEWRSKFKSDFIIFVSILLNDGSIKYLGYSPKQYSNLSNDVLFIKLQQWASDGKWYTYKRNLNLDLQRYFPDLKIDSVLDFQVRGVGCLDDIKLLKINSSLKDENMGDKIDKLNKKIDAMSNNTTITINNTNSNDNSDVNNNNNSDVNNNTNNNLHDVNNSKNLNLSGSIDMPDMPNIGDMMSGFAGLMTQFASMMTPMMNTFMQMMEEMMNAIFSRASRSAIMPNNQRMDFLNHQLLDISKEMMRVVVKMQDYGLNLNKLDTTALMKVLADLENNNTDINTISNAMNAYLDLLNNISHLVVTSSSSSVNFAQLSRQMVDISDSLLLFSARLLKESLRIQRPSQQLSIFANFIKEFSTIIFNTTESMVNNQQISSNTANQILSSLTLINRNMVESDKVLN